MKIWLNIVAGIFTITATIPGVISTNNVKANVVVGAEKNKKIVFCQTDYPDGTVFYGTYCNSGTFYCIPNPCDW